MVAVSLKMWGFLPLGVSVCTQIDAEDCYIVGHIGPALNLNVMNGNFHDRTNNLYTFAQCFTKLYVVLYLPSAALVISCLAVEALPWLLNNPSTK